MLASQASEAENKVPCAPVAVFGRGARAGSSFSGHFKPTNGKVPSAAKDSQVLALSVWRETLFFLSLKLALHTPTHTRTPCCFVLAAALVCILTVSKYFLNQIFLPQGLQPKD